MLLGKMFLGEMFPVQPSAFEAAGFCPGGGGDQRQAAMGSGLDDGVADGRGGATLEW